MVKPYCLTAIFVRVYSPASSHCTMESSGSSTATQTAAARSSLHWLALALTPGLGPTRGRKLVEHFGGIEQVFQATLTELEACGVQVVSAQSLGTGRSTELAQEELIRAASAGAHIVVLDSAEYPPLLRQIYDPPLALYVRGRLVCSHRRGWRLWGRGILLLMVSAWRSGWPVISLPRPDRVQRVGARG